jgi:fluoride exporter
MAHSVAIPVTAPNGDTGVPRVDDVIARRESIAEASSLATIDRPPSETENVPAPKIYPPLSFPVLALLAPASVFGALARVGLSALVTYDGQSIFALAYAQTIGCFIMGFAIELKEPIGNL